jgi:hypothetical protein
MAAPNRSLGILLGFGLGAIVQIFGLILAFIVLKFSLPLFWGPQQYGDLGALVYSIFFIGLYQLIYMIPLVIFLKYKRHIGVMQGVIAVTALTVLINGGCFLLTFLRI